VALETAGTTFSRKSLVSNLRVANRDPHDYCMHLGPPFERRGDASLCSLSPANEPADCRLHEPLAYPPRVLSGEDTTKLGESVVSYRNARKHHRGEPIRTCVRWRMEDGRKEERSRLCRAGFVLLFPLSPEEEIRRRPGFRIAHRRRVAWA
jgi:hypothetical protein